jgi:hypothetical protein
MVKTAVVTLITQSAMEALQLGWRQPHFVDREYENDHVGVARFDPHEDQRDSLDFEPRIADVKEPHREDFEI